jgi:hypothetical protein
MTIEEMKAAILKERDAMIPPGFARLSPYPECDTYFSKGGWQLTQYAESWRAACIGKNGSFHASGDGLLPVDAIIAVKVELRRIAAAAVVAAAEIYAAGDVG